jgi:hypothetical protein
MTLPWKSHRGNAVLIGYTDSMFLVVARWRFSSAVERGGVA